VLFYQKPVLSGGIVCPMSLVASQKRPIIHMLHSLEIQPTCAEFDKRLNLIELVDWAINWVNSLIKLSTFYAGQPANSFMFFYWSIHLRENI